MGETSHKTGELVSKTEPIHPGETLRKDILEPNGLTQIQVAELMRISYPRLNEIINGKRGLTIDTALRLERLFGWPASMWLTLQQDYDLAQIKKSDLWKEISSINPLT